MRVKREEERQEVRSFFRTSSRTSSRFTYHVPRTTYHVSRASCHGLISTLRTIFRSALIKMTEYMPSGSCGSDQKDQ